MNNMQLRCTLNKEFKNKKCTNALKFRRDLYAKNANSHKNWKARLIADYNDRINTNQSKMSCRVGAEIFSDILIYF